MWMHCFRNMEFIRAKLLLQGMQEGSKAGKERKRDMKQFLKRTIAGAACLAMALLFAGSASAKGDIFTQRQILVDEDCICGVIFLGYVDGEKYLADDEEYRMQVLENSGYTEEFEFLTEIPSDRIVETDWGAELYCIYPRRADAVVAVNACGYEESEENGYDLVVGEMMFESRSGAPKYPSVITSGLVVSRHSRSSGTSANALTSRDSRLPRKWISFRLSHLANA